MGTSDFTEQKAMPPAKPACAHPIISKIIDMDKSWMTEDDHFYLDLFLLSYYTGGSSISKLASLKTDELQDAEKILVTKDGRKLFEKYQDAGPDGYLLPIYSRKHTTSQQQNGKVKRLSAQINQLLKTLSRKLKLPQVITFRSAQQFMLEHLIDCDFPVNKTILFTGVSFEKYERCWQKRRSSKTWC